MRRQWSPFTCTALGLFIFSFSAAASAGTPAAYEPWHTTHGLEKFPCMDELETAYFQRLINVTKNEEKTVILSEHRKSVKKQGRAPANVSPHRLISKQYICPPFRGVRNPYPGVHEFGTASPFELIKLTGSEMQILSGLKKNERWPLSFDSQKGYFQGQTKTGTPVNLIPLLPAQGDVRFLIQYMVWQDKTPPSLTLCYRADLHQQCNPYKKPEPSKTATTPEGRLPASVGGRQGNKG